ncbi:hypothetical protein HWV62_24099 [Athelia sp. TMB]|nr:hypothetical protein HWV62_24099 [Athelia sp. TMB]
MLLAIGGLRNLAEAPVIYLPIVTATRPQQEPLLRVKQQASPASGSSMLKLYIALFVAAVLICNFVGLVLWDSSCQNKNLVQYEKEVASRKAQEAQRELEWVREMDKKREEEHARETQWQTEYDLKKAQEAQRELEWVREMDKKREEERARETRWQTEYDLKKAQEARRELAWERHMNETQESERTREAQWKRSYDLKRAQEKQQQRAWERQMDNKRREERTREAQWEMSQEKRERLGLSWSAPLSHGCVSHGVQSYRARLLDAGAYNYNKIVPCMEMPISIHGVSRIADHCERQGNVGVLRLIVCSKH